ncbi:OmpA family protein, partial [Leptotrichia sp. OH3620_COT-345]
RINALELDEIDITKVKGPKEVTVVLDERALLFNFDKSNVKAQYYGILQNLKEYIIVNDYDVTIVGHTDSKGTNEYN